MAKKNKVESSTKEQLKEEKELSESVNAQWWFHLVKESYDLQTPSQPSLHSFQFQQPVKDWKFKKSDLYMGTFSKFPIQNMEENYWEFWEPEFYERTGENTCVRNYRHCSCLSCRSKLFMV